MPTLTPQITLTAKLDDLAGAVAGSAANPAKLLIALCGFGLSLPRIVGTANLAKIGPYQLPDTGAGISVLLWGNDVISPADTFYTITVLDGEGNVVQCGAYRFTGAETIDLSNAIQITPANALAYTPTSGAVPGAIYNAPGRIILLFENGVALTPGIDYSTADAGTTADLNFTTEAGDVITALCAVVNVGELIPGAWMLQWTGCTGAVPGTAYVAPGPVAAVAINGILLQPVIDYTIAGGTAITLTVPTAAGDRVDALCVLV
jgi:hypothetical protein